MVAVFAIALVLGFIRLVLGIRGALDIRRRSQIIEDREPLELLDVLQAELG